MNHRPSIGAAFTGLLVAVCLLLSGCDKHAQEKKDIKATWKAYNDASEANDGQGMVKVLDKKTLEHYDLLIKTGLDGKPAEVLAMDPVDQHEILLMRNRATRKQVKGYNGKGYVIYAVNQGWWSGFGADDWALKSIKVNGDSAEAKITEVVPSMFSGAGYRASLRQSMWAQRNRKPREYPVKFVQEDGAWKLDELSLVPRSNEELVAAAKAYRMSMRDFLMVWEEDESGKDVTIQIWEPMK